MKFVHSSDACFVPSIAFATPPSTGPPAIRGVPLHPSVSLTTSGRGGRSPLTSLDGFNAAPADAAEAALLACCRSHRWAARVAAHRPYPDPASLLAAAEEASYDLSGEEVVRALACEKAPAPGPDAPPSARTALHAARAAYESRFGHAFVICLDSYPPSRHLDRTLWAIRYRLGNEPDEERAVAADELRLLARGRLARLVGETGPSGAGPVPVPR
ncbi:2-oxo-4-hydroxy-4-carboxy-5-ureidoimidazoline decarboxylase [Streptomyces candidus]|uniref:2-oxo-4-hydroxy-4-carboxy-5-ureidoimidazoline decarboxylase n=1 Tax=Streptomyces candidus TaxID=67283 RepID=A0A7X0HEL4_9ACTN|nr:2-oxo-4-hydroxy-4-carboxy-5-ureidoimidazoline decarboxylase [Streptomyces candidus]MBB6435049.1 2-oxo-4-hydroxy-4-carboxy-5-ureidoimidazoline decarboxylase [Streptomyces candidus]